MPKKGYKQTEEHRRKKAFFRQGKPLSEETKRKMSRAKKGKMPKNIELLKKKAVKFKKGCPAPKTAFKKGDLRLIGENNPAKRPEVGKKISEAKKEHIVTKEIRKKISKKLTGRKLSDEHRRNMGNSVRGEKSHLWEGGITPLNKLLRNQSKFKIWREVVFLRDNYTCQNPDCEFCNNKIGVLLHPHHIKSFIKFPELRFDINNGITYCAEFHIKSGLHKNIRKIQKEVGNA